MKKTPLLFLPALLWMLPAGSHAQDEAPSRVVFGSRNYVEYARGELPIIITSPHGGREAPEDIPDRLKGVLQADANTQELARFIADEIQRRAKKPAHLVICRLHRKKVDMNREIEEAAQADPIAETAWKEYHGFIDQAAASAIQLHNLGFIIDLHGHAHLDQRVELGYLHTPAELARSEAEVNDPAFAAAGSLRLIAAQSKLPYTELLHGPRSFGAFLQAEGYRCTPSPAMPVPTEPFFRGGYTLQRHTKPARMTGLQVECNRLGVRDTPENRQAFARGFVSALNQFFLAQLGRTLDGMPVSIPVQPAKTP